MKNRLDHPENRFVDELLRKPPPALSRNELTVADAAVAVAAVFGTLGAILISDDYDFLRYAALGLGGVPLAVLYGAGRVLFPKWRGNSPRAVRACAVSLVLLFGTGVAPLVNALGSDGVKLKRTIPLGAGQSLRDVYRGGLGWVFTAPKWWGELLQTANGAPPAPPVRVAPKPALTYKPIRRL